MKRAFTVHLKKETSDKVLSECCYTFSSEDSADRFVESITGFDIDYVGIIYGSWVEKKDSEGNRWFILYDQPTVLDPEKVELERVKTVDYF